MPASEDRGNERSGAAAEEDPPMKTDGWLNTYADMVTLLLTFFVLMLALSSTDTAKLEMFLLAMSKDGITAEQFWEIQDKYNFQDVELDSRDDMWPLPGQWPEEGEDDRVGDAALQELHDTMQEYIEQEQLGEVISLTFNGDFLLIVLASDILFRSGSAEMTPEMHESAAVLGRLIANTFQPVDPFEIVVAGHTDNVPINTAAYPSNWHLSSSRATNFLYELLTVSGLDPGFFNARALGEERPVATNSTPEGRARNRRVEVMVSLARDNPTYHDDSEYYREDNDSEGLGSDPDGSLG